MKLKSLCILGSIFCLCVLMTHARTPTSHDVGAQKFTETEVSNGAGMFSQLFLFLDTFISDLQQSQSSSSKRWSISAYSPQEGSGWESGPFEEVFLPVRVQKHDAALYSRKGNFYQQIRAYAEYLYRPRAEVETVIAQFLSRSKFDPTRTVCLHVRRGDKAEGIRRVQDGEIIDVLQLALHGVSRVYLLTDDENFDVTFAEIGKRRNISHTTFSEEACIRESELTRAQCFIASVLVATRNVCDTFVGSSTSNLSRFIMLLGPRFVDIDGVMDYVSTKMFGRWYKPPDHCYVVDGILPSGEVCGYLSYRCPYCRTHNCTPIPPCEMPP